MARPIQTGQHASTIYKPTRIRRSIKGAYWSVTSGSKGRTVFTTCVSWILIPSRTRTNIRRNDPQPCKRERKGNTGRPDSRSVVILTPSLSSLMASFVWRRRLRINVLPDAYPPFKSIPICRRVSMSRTVLRSHRCTRPIAAFEAPRVRQAGLASRGWSGRMTQHLTSISGKCSKIKYSNYLC